MNGDRRRRICERDDITITIIVEINNGDIECLLRCFVIDRRIETAGTIAIHGDKALGHSARWNSSDDIGKTITVNTASRQLFWHRNEVGEQNYFGRAKSTASVISPDR